MNQSIPVPRFQGRAFQEGKSWKWEIHIRIGPLDPLVMTTNEAFISQWAAIKNLRKTVPDVIRETCKAMGIPAEMVTGVHDLKNNMMHADADAWAAEGEGGDHG